MKKLEAYAPGDHIGSWEVVGPASIYGRLQKQLLRCHCGTERILALSVLRAGRSQSCGCRRAQLMQTQMTRHGDARRTEQGGKTRLYGIWKAMKQRCGDPNSIGYADYGGRGITVCAEWIHAFPTFREWAQANGYDDSKSIDRRDNYAGYSPTNCQWSTAKHQANNRRTSRVLDAFGEQKSLADWIRDPRCVVSYGALKSRVNDYLWPIETALTTPRYVHFHPNKPHKRRSKAEMDQALRLADGLGAADTLPGTGTFSGCNPASVPVIGGLVPVDAT